MSDMPNDQPTSVPSGADSACGNAEPKRNGLAGIIIAARDSLTEQNWTRGFYFDTNKHGVCMCAHGALQAIVNPLVAAVLAEGGAYVARVARSAYRDAQMAHDTMTRLEDLAAHGALQAIATTALRTGAEPSAAAAESAKAAEAACDASGASGAAAAAEAAAARAGAAGAALAAADSAGAAGAADMAARAAEAVATRSWAFEAAAAARATAAGPAARAARAADTAMSDTGAGTAFAAHVSDVYGDRPDWVRKNTAAGNLDAHFILGLVGLTSQYNDSEKNTLDDIKKKMTEAADLADTLGAQYDHVV